MHQQHIGIALRADLDRLPGADGHHVDAAVAQLLELGQDVIEQAGVGGAGGGGEFEHLLAGRGGRCFGRLAAAAVGCAGAGAAAGAQALTIMATIIKLRQQQTTGEVFMWGLLFWTAISVGDSPVILQ